MQGQFSVSNIAHVGARSPGDLSLRAEVGKVSKLEVRSGSLGDLVVGGKTGLMKTFTVIRAPG